MAASAHTMQITFLDEGTHSTSATIFPDQVKLDEIKDTVRKDRDFAPDSKCGSPGHPLKLFYPDGGLDQLEEEDHSNEGDGSVATPSRRRKKHHAMLELKDDKRWTTAKSQWALGYSKRRDHSLVKYSTEVCDIIGQIPDAEATFQAARRLCSIMGVPLNVSNIFRLRKSYLVFKAVLDLVEYRDPTVPGDDGWGPRRVFNNCEPLSVACGAHLHWSLATQSEKYFLERVSGTQKPKSVGELEVPPQYESFQRLLLLGQGRHVRVNFRGALLSLYESVVSWLDQYYQNTVK
jgi:hypothetical protein